MLNQCRDRGYPICDVSFCFYDKDISDDATKADVLKPESPYVFSKHIGEQSCALLESHFDLNVVTLRLANIYGPGQRKDCLNGIYHYLACRRRRRKSSCRVLLPAPRVLRAIAVRGRTKSTAREWI